MPPVSHVLFFFLNCLGTFAMTFFGLYEFPVFYVEMNVLLGLVIVPVGAFLSSAALSGIMWLLRFKVTGLTFAITSIVAAAIATGCFIVGIGNSTVSGYFSHLYSARSEYNDEASLKKMFPHVDAQVEKSLGEKLPTNYIVTISTFDDHDADLVIFEAMAPSILYGNVLYDGVYRVKEDRITDLVTADDIWKQMLLKKHYRSSSNFDRLNMVEDFNRRDILFPNTDMNRCLEASWAVENDKIQIQDVQYCN